MLQDVFVNKKSWMQHFESRRESVFFAGVLYVTMGLQTSSSSHRMLRYDKAKQGKEKYLGPRHRKEQWQISVAYINLGA